MEKTKWQVFDWANNDVGSPVFDFFDDASEWLDYVILKNYGNLNDEDYDLQREEYVINEVTSDEDL